MEQKHSFYLQCHISPFLIQDLQKDLLYNDSIKKQVARIDTCRLGSQTLTLSLGLDHFKNKANILP